MDEVCSLHNLAYITQFTVKLQMTCWIVMVIAQFTTGIC